MHNLQEAKGMGAAGSVLMMISWIFPGKIIVFILGMILALVAVDWISNLTNDREISFNMTLAVLLVVIGVLAGTIITYGSTNYTNFITASPYSTGTISFTDALYSSLSSLVLGLFAIWFFFILTSYFLRKAYDSLSERLGVGLFHTAALLFFAGAVMIIIAGLGFVLIFIAATVQLAAFLAIPEKVDLKETSRLDPGH